MRTPGGPSGGMEANIPCIALPLLYLFPAMLARSPFQTLVLVLLLAAPAAAQTMEYDGAVALGLSLRRLGTTARVLHIGAHPDDENTALLAGLALGRGADVAYLSLTRGDGGQNGIGPELGEGLGLIRSEELLAARRLDGAEQFFTRAYDFGYSKSAEEAFRHWPRDSLLADVVAVVRRYRPDVIVAVFSGTPADGHGQHEVSGILAREAFLAAGDPNTFPDQIAAGLRPHAPDRFFRSARFRPDQGTASLDTGARDPLLGRSHHQVAMASRSRHRSQDMGVPQAPGPRRTTVARIDPATNEPIPPDRTAGDILTGVPVTLAGRADALAREAGRDAGSVLDRVAPTLRQYDDAIAEVRPRLNPLDPSAGIHRLTELRVLLEQALRELSVADGGPAAELAFHVAEEIQDVDATLLQAANVEVDVVAEKERVVPGQTVHVRLSVRNGGVVPVTVRSFDALLPDGWTVEPAPAREADDTAGFRARLGSVQPTAAEPPAELAPDGFWVRHVRVRVADDATPTMPYYLRDERRGDLYSWPDDPSVRGLPFQPDPIRGAARLAIGTATIRAERDAAYVGVDERDGEYRRPVAVVPAVSVRVAPELAVVPHYRLGRPVDVTVRLRNEMPGGLAGTLRLDAPDGWTVEPVRGTGADAVPVRFDAQGEERSVRFRVRPRADADHGLHAVRAVFDAGPRFDRGYELVDHPHIRPHRIYRPAETAVRVLDVEVADGIRVGYVAGAGGAAPEALAQLDVAVESLDEAILAAGDLDRYDVVVTGIRAYEVRPDLATHNGRLLDYVERGGVLVVLYNKYEYAAAGYAPFPVEMARPHDRVTDEGAPVTLLEPEHPILSWPNEIGPADWDGWQTERGLYFLSAWPDIATPLLEMADPGEDPKRGALVVAPHGEGLWVYTGLSLFRQLPAGLPGAYRLLANLVSLGAR